MRRRTFWQVSSILAIGILCSLPALAQRGRPRSPIYDRTTEVTVQGSVEAVRQVMGPRGWGGTHLTLKTDKESFDVPIGPTWFLTQEKISFAKGDQIEVTGSRSEFENHALLARQIKRGGETFVFRNHHGVPAWSRGYRGPS